MKVAIISDTHANLAALRAFPESYDELWVVGDLVNFGPKPGEVIDWVRRHAHCVVRGNHDHGVGYGTDPRCVPEYQTLAAETGKYSTAILTEDQKESIGFLCDLGERAFSLETLRAYPFGETITAIEAMPISSLVQEQLSELITTGGLKVGGV